MTRRIGRYEILGPLAIGGMAEIHLARLVGPAGFERAVVLKRMRTDVPAEDLKELFLGEARVAAKIRHANVVNVEDLGTDERGDPYLVMEYLEGESVSNIVRRLESRGERMPAGLSAFIVAESCAGLHAAHELCDADGRAVGLVHRDVSPQNLFVTYAGAVKVVDFGIAKTATSTSDTNPGEVRGKCCYIAPEQARGQPVDRRADIFALGVVLHELLTGHRLFKRFSDQATLRAVTSDPLVAPSRVDAKVPAILDAICLRALARDIDERYATAAEMRRELLLALRGLASEEPSAELAELMGRAFPDRIEQKRALLRNVRAGSIVEHIPAGDVDVDVELPTLGGLATGTEHEGTASLAAPAPPLDLAPAPAPPPNLVPATAAPSTLGDGGRGTTERAQTSRGRRLAVVALVSASAAVATGFALTETGLLARSRTVTSTAAVTKATANGEPTQEPPEPAPGPGPEEVAAPSASSSAAAVAPSSGPAASTAARGELRSGRRPSRPAGLSRPAAEPGPAVAIEPSPSASARGYRRFQ